MIAFLTVAHIPLSLLFLAFALGFVTHARATAGGANNGEDSRVAIGGGRAIQGACAPKIRIGLRRRRTGDFSGGGRLGGHAAGEKAAETAVEVIRIANWRSPRGTLRLRIRAAITAANNRILRMAAGKRNLARHGVRADAGRDCRTTR